MHKELQRIRHGSATTTFGSAQTPSMNAGPNHTDSITIYY